MDACLSIVSFLEVHDLCHLSKITLSSVLDLIQPDIAGEGCCPKESARSSKRKVVVLKTCRRTILLRVVLSEVGRRTAHYWSRIKLITE